MSKLVTWLAVISAVAYAVADDSGTEEVLIGWKGETYSSGIKQPSEKKTDIYGSEPWVETISWSPRAFVHHNFLTAAECDHLVDIGSKRVHRSMVVDASTGQTKLDEIRTSFGAAFARGEDPVIAEIEERLAEWTHLPPDYGEQMQILRYVDGQKYGAHWDWFDDPMHKLQQGNQLDNRYATVVLYLSDVEEGGETNLPLATALDYEAQKPVGMSSCASEWGISVRPRKGDALLFYDMDILATQGDRRTLHTACPALNGTKWTATKWIHNRPYLGRYDPMQQASRCVDSSTDCARLAAAGECSSNMDKMVGLAGLCRKTCHDCVVCQPSDVVCARRNMHSLVRTQAAAAAAAAAAAKLLSAGSKILA